MSALRIIRRVVRLLVLCGLTLAATVVWQLCLPCVDAVGWAAIRPVKN